MEELLKTLSKLYEEGISIDGEDGWKYFENEGIGSEAACLANEYLITNDGRCNWKNIDILKSNGYSVFAGEKDSFGWLTGCIKKNGDNRILVYG